MKTKTIFLSTITPVVFLLFFSLIRDSFSSPQGKGQGKQEFSEDIQTNQNGKGTGLEIIFNKGEAHNHPLMAVWVEDTAGNFIQTLFVARSIGTGIFRYGDQSSGQWAEGQVRRPAALPYWSHKRGIKAKDGLYMPTPEQPVPDAYTGATPQGSFTLHTQLDQPGQEVFKVLIEINQPWDFNDYWTNAKFPGNNEYTTSAQPAVVYETTINLDDTVHTYPMKIIGHSHYAGENGKLYTNMGTLTTALHIAREIKVKVK